MYERKQGSEEGVPALRFHVLFDAGFDRAQIGQIQRVTGHVVGRSSELSYVRDRLGDIRRSGEERHTRTSLGEFDGGLFADATCSAGDQKCLPGEVGVVQVGVLSASCKPTHQTDDRNEVEHNGQPSPRNPRPNAAGHDDRIGGEDEQKDRGDERQQSSRFRLTKEQQ